MKDKLPVKGVCTWSCDPLFKFGTTLISLQRTKLHTSKLLCSASSRIEKMVAGVSSGQMSWVGCSEGVPLPTTGGPAEFPST